MLLSAAKVVYLWIDYVFGYLLRIYPLLAASRLVIFDRYYHDLLVDDRRFRYGGPRWLARLVARMIPLPDLVLVLDAPAEILQARKQEVPAAESARQADAYQAVAFSDLMRGRATLIDASLPLDEVVQQCTDRTLAVLAERTTRRLEAD
jgi:thymidylate kinase